MTIGDQDRGRVSMSVAATCCESTVTIFAAWGPLLLLLSLLPPLRCSPTSQQTWLQTRGCMH